MEKFNPYHQHLLVKCWITNPPKKEEQLNKWFINLVEYTKSIGKEFWLVGENKSNYLEDLLKSEHVKHYDATNKVENFVKNCSETAGILLGRTTIEGWMCGKPGWIYNVDESGYILNKEKFDIPKDINKFNSLEVSKKIKEEYIKILN